MKGYTRRGPQKDHFDRMPQELGKRFFHAGEGPVKLIISGAATARFISMTRFVATYTPTRRGGSADFKEGHWGT